MADTFTMTQTISTGVTQTLSNPIVDGWVRSDNGKSTTDNYLRCGIDVGKIYRSFVEWNLSTLPTGTVITSAKFLYHCVAEYEYCCIRECLGERPSTNSAASLLYTECGEGSFYSTTSAFPATGANQIITLGVDSTSTACIDIGNQISSGWFAIGVQKYNDAGGITWIYSEEAGGANPPPSLYIEYNISPTCTFNQPETITRGYTRKTESFLFPDGTFKRHDVGSGGKTITMQGTETSSATSNFNTLDTMMAQGEHVTLSDMNNSDLNTDWYISDFTWKQNEGYVNIYDWSLVLMEV